MKAKHVLFKKKNNKKTTIGKSVNSKRRHGKKNRQKKFACDNGGQG